MKKIYTAFFCCYALLFSLPSFSQTWNGSVSSDWNNAANWTPNNVPSTSGNVIINNASANYKPLLPGNVSIRTLNLSAGFLHLNGFTLTCSVSATLTGDSLYNGKISSATFNDVANMHMGGKIILDKTGASNESWQGKNKFHGDSLIIIWRTGGLSMENATLSPDSIFGNLKLVYSDNNETNYRISIGVNSPIYIQNDLILDNPDKGTFGLDYPGEKIIGGNIKAIDFSSAVPNFPLVNVTVLGSNVNGPFRAHTGSIDNCRINGNFSFVADSNVTINITNSYFAGADNLLQAGGLWTHDNIFGQTVTNNTIIRAAYNGTDGSVRLRGGNNKFFGNAQWETYASYPGGVTIEHNFYGNDTTLGNLNFVMKGNASLVTNTTGNNYVGGNLVIDGQGARKWIQFSGDGGSSCNVGGNFSVMNFTPYSETGVAPTNVYLRNLHVAGTAEVGTFYCYAGDINNSSFNGNFSLVADSSVGYTIVNSLFLGADNLFQAGTLTASNDQFGYIGIGTTTLRATNNTGSNAYMRDGNNKFFGNVNWETYAVYPSGVTIQQNFYGVDSCWGNMNFILKGNAALSTNGNGNNYVAGNVIIDGQGARKWVQFTGGAANTFSVGGNFTVKNFTPFSEPGVGPTNVYLRNLFVTGSDTVGTFYCYTGDINGSSFNGNFKLIADSSQVYALYYSSFLGADNLFQSGTLDFHDNKFGQSGNGTTRLMATNNTGANTYMRDGLNKFFSNAQWETYALYPSGVTIQQNFYGADSVLGNLNFILKGNAALTTNGNGNNYVAGNVVIDGQGARKWVQFTGGAANTFSVNGSFTVKNFTPFSEAGVGPTNVHLRNLFVNGTDTVGTFYCYTGDINSSIFNGNFKLIADSSQGYVVNNSFLLGADNLLQAGIVETQNNKFGQTGSGTTILRSALNSGSNYMRDGNNKFFGNAQWDAFASPAGSILIQQTFFGADTCLGNVTINLKGLSSADLAGNGLYIGKGLSLQNNGTGTIAQTNSVPGIHFIGADTANYAYGGTGSAPSFIMLEMNRRGGLRLLSPLTYRDYLVFTRGIILSSPSNPVIVPASAVVIGPWDSSYVDGPVRRIGNTAFTFPLGTNNVYAPLSITAPSLTTDAFTVQYFNHLAHIDGYDSTQHDVSLNHLSRKEYWTVERTMGTSNVKVTLSWKTLRSGVVNSITDLRVAHWNGSTWKDEGIGAISGDNDEGTIQSFNTISSFSPFTLASTTTSNQLPVRFITFDVQLQKEGTVWIQWTTANEINNDHFEVQRSNDLVNWLNLQAVFPNATGAYSYMDYGAGNGINYYRIQQVDPDGTCSYTQIKMIDMQSKVIFLWPNPVVNEMHLRLPFSNGIIDITDEAGKKLLTKIINATNMVIPLHQLKAGIYFVTIKTAGELHVLKFLKM
jgi:hypothetical protein